VVFYTPPQKHKRLVA